MFRLDVKSDYIGDIAIRNDSPSTSPIRLILEGWFKVRSVSTASVNILFNGKNKTCRRVKRVDVMQATGFSASDVFGFECEIFSHELFFNKEAPLFLESDGVINHVASVNFEGNNELINFLDDIDGRNSSPGVLLITSVGRSGSTALYESLLGFDGIVGRKYFPYESHYIQKLAQIVELNIRYIGRRGEIPWDSINSSFALMQLSQDDDYLEDDLSELMIRSILGGFYRALNEYSRALLKIESNASALYICEKSTIGFPAIFLSVLMPRFREIILVRDIRDVMISYLEYAKINSTSSFARYSTLVDVSKDVEAYYRELTLRAQWPFRLVVRYEDLIFNRQHVMSSIIDFLAINNSVQMVGKESTGGVAAGHVSSPGGNIKNTIGRWKREYIDEMREAYNPDLQKMNIFFGYE